VHPLRLISTGIALAAGLTMVMAAGGCRGERSDDPPRQFFPDMDDQPKWKPQSQSQFFADGRTMRPRVEGTVAFGYSENPAGPERTMLLKDDPAFFFGADEGGAVVDYMPQSAIDAFRSAGQGTGEAMAAMIAHGMERYNIYCSACHGYTGDGKGAAGARWSYPLPTYFDSKYTDRAQPTGKDGHLFNVIRNGVIDQTGAVKMPAYNHAVEERDAWAIVAYLRTLQASHVTDLSEVPEEKRGELERSRPLPEAPVTPGPAAVEPPAEVVPPDGAPAEQPPAEPADPATPAPQEGQ
jgi:mono/diheme cytochrome c family protein